MGFEESGFAHAEMAEEAQRHLFRHLRCRGFPVLPAFDQEGIARVFGIVEERVVAQPPAGGMPAVDDDVLR